MKHLIGIIKQINPFVSGQKNSKGAFIIQKCLAFFLIYAVASLVMEGVFIVGFSSAGYDLLHGDMPTGQFIELLPLYGFIGFSCVTMLYVKLVEKSKLSLIMLHVNLRTLLIYVGGLFAGGVLIILIIFMLTLTGAYEFQGTGKLEIVGFLTVFAAYIFQSFGEEIMCRGFLQNVLAKRIGVPAAIAISAIAFIIPHLSTILTFDTGIRIVAIINIFLVSVLFSLVMLQCNSLLASCGLHAGWNFVLNKVLGLTVSGGEQSDGLLQLMVNEDTAWLTGGAYGIEAGVALVLILLIIDSIFVIQIRRRKANGIRKQAV